MLIIDNNQFIKNQKDFWNILVSVKNIEIHWLLSDKEEKESLKNQ
jgi:hypothetical protein